jgi:tetratricopeptide (TPR) repeat protein
MLKRIIPALFLAVFGVASVHAQIRSVPADISIRGKVFLGTGQGADRVEVRLESGEFQPIATTYTDGIGNFEFRSVPAGNYFIRVKADGYEEARQAVDMVTLARGAATVTIALNRPATVTNQSSGDSDVVDITDLQRKYSKKAVQEYEKAIEAIRKNELEKAITLMEDVVKLEPDFYQAHNNLGVFYQRAERYRDAEKEYDTARELNPRAAEPLVNIGSLLIQESDTRRNESRTIVGRILDDALDILEEAVKMDPRSAVGYYYLGSAYYKSDFYDDAEQNLLRSQKLDPKSRPVRLMLINVYMKTAKWQNVLDQLNAYLKENPKAPDRAQMQEMRDKVIEGLQAQKK